MEACHKRCVCSLFLLQLLLLLSSFSSSSSKTLQGSDSYPSRSQILAATDNDAFSGKKIDATSDSYKYNVGGRKVAGVKTESVNNIGATNMDEDTKKKICKEGAVKVDLRNGVESRSKEKQSRAGFGGEEKDSEVVEEAGFVAFNADYHTPRHHPPKNN